MSALRSNLVTIVNDGSEDPQVARLVEQLRKSEIFVSEVPPRLSLTPQVISHSHPGLAETLRDSDSNIVLSLLTKKQLLSTLTKESIASLDKLWVSIPADGEALDVDEQTDVLLPGAKLQVPLLRSPQGPSGDVSAAPREGAAAIP